MAIWDEILQEASFADIEFPVSQRKVSGGRALARRRYPNRPGQAIEDQGREPYSFQLEVPLFASMDPDLYPATYEQLRAAFDDPETYGEAEYVDPELGPLRAKVVSWTWSQSADERDGGRLTFDLEEISFDDQVFALRVGGGDPQGVAAEQARVLDEGLGSAGVDEGDLGKGFAAAGVKLTEDEAEHLAGELWSTQLFVFVEALDDGLASAEGLAARVDTIRGRVNVLLEQPLMQGAAATPLAHAAARFADALGSIAERVVAEAPPLVEVTLADTISVYELAVQLYGEVGRADEILQRNPTSSPLFLQRGTVLTVLSR